MASLSGQAISTTFRSLLKLAGNTDDLAPGGSTAIQVMTGDGENTPIYLNTDRVGIGTSAPDVALHINKSGTGGVLRLENSDTTITANEVLGQIEFEGQDDGTNASGVRAKIAAFGSTGGVTGETDIAFYTSIAGDNLSEKMRILDDGNVGIGNPNPGSNLEISKVSGAATLELSSWSATATEAHAGKLKFQKSGTATVNTFTAGDHTTAGEVLGRIEAWGVDDSDGETLSSYIEFANDAISDADSSPGKIIFATSDSDDAGTPTPRMTIDDSGNVGIGISAPETLLQISTTDNTTIDTIDGTNSNSNANYNLLLKNHSTTQNSFAGVAFDISSENDNDSTSASIYAIRVTSGTDADHQAHLGFATNGEATSDQNLTERMRILNNGNVGIGETNPSNVLHMKGSTADAFVLQVEHTHASDPNGVIVQYSGGHPNNDDSDYFFLGFDDATSVGTPRFRVDGKGNVETTSGNNITAISDERLKENIADYAGGLAIINALRPRTFTWKDGVDRGMSGTRYGFIAQEVMGISGYEENMGLARKGKLHAKELDAIKTLCSDGDIYKSQISSVECLLISAIKELSAKVTELENK